MIKNMFNNNKYKKNKIIQLVSALQSIIQFLLSEAR